jgi:hypothetical protein
MVIIWEALYLLQLQWSNIYMHFVTPFFMFGTFSKVSSMLPTRVSSIGERLNFEAADV